MNPSQAVPNLPHQQIPNEMREVPFRKSSCHTDRDLPILLADPEFADISMTVYKSAYHV